MKHKRRLLTLLAIPLLLVPALNGCALAREGNPVTTPKTGPGTPYPCGVSGVVCEDARTSNEKCCPGNHACRRDPDGTPFCEFVNFDPSDPSQWAAKPRRVRRTAPK